MTIDKVRGSGLKAAALAAQTNGDGDAEIVIGCDQECLGFSPHVPQGPRDGQRRGDCKMIDSMITDSLWDVCDQHQMGITAENVAFNYGVTLERQAALASGSQHGTANVLATACSKHEIVSIAQRKGEPVVVDADELVIPTTNAEALAGTRPVFEMAGNFVADTASELSDCWRTMMLLSSWLARCRPKWAGTPARRKSMNV